MMVGFNWAPRGWALCDGQLLQISQYAALYSLLGTKYGGDGVNTFAVPDLRGRVAVNQGTGAGLTTRSMGEKNGYEVVTLTKDAMPVHNHKVQGKIQATTNTAGANSPAENVLATLPRGTNIYGGPENLVEMATEAIELAVEDAGRGKYHENMQPFLVVNFVIALEGTFPPRN